MNWVLCLTVLLAVHDCVYSLPGKRHSKYVTPSFGSTDFKDEETSRSNELTIPSDTHNEPQHKATPMRFVINMPDILKNLERYTGLNIFDGKRSKDGSLHKRSKDESNIFQQQITVQVNPMGLNNMFGYLKDLIQVEMHPSRRELLSREVMESVGVIKSPPVNVPKGFLEGNLQNILKLQQFREKHADD